jgi:hypothetical protein
VKATTRPPLPGDGDAVPLSGGGGGGEAKLYRASHGTFEGYCRERWGMSRSYAHRMIESSAVVEMLPIGNKPATESQARPLAKLPAEEQAPPCPATGGGFFDKTGGGIVKTRFSAG